MKKAGWFVKNVVFPMAPFVLGAMARSIHSGSFGLDTLSGAELAFSVAMLTLLMSTKASKLKNEDVREALESMFQMAVIVFLTLFAWTVLIETELTASFDGVWLVAQERAESGTPLTVSDLPDRIGEYQVLLGRLRLVVVATASVVLPLTVIAAYKYKLEEL